MKKHISIRVPWHDNNWNGAICSQPQNNPFCTMLSNISQSKDTNMEQKFACKSWSELGPDSLPACKSENGGFMNEKAYKRIFKHVYSNFRGSPHYNLKPTTIKVPPYTIFGVPFRYMSRDNAEELDLKYPYFAEDEIVSDKIKWVYGAQRQFDILNWFVSNIQPDTSLTVLYCKNGNPIDEECGRLIIGMGEICKIHKIIQYDTEMTTKYPAWDIDRKSVG